MTLHELGIRLVAELNRLEGREKWKDGSNKSPDYTHVFRFQGEGQQHMSMRFTGRYTNPQERIIVTAWWPNRWVMGRGNVGTSIEPRPYDPLKYLQHGGHPPPLTITAATNRTPERIAKDIFSRLLKEYYQWWDKAMDTYRKDRDTLLTERGLLQEIGDILGESPSADRLSERYPELYIYGGASSDLYARINTDHSRVSFKDLHVTPACGLEIAEVIAKHYKKGKYSEQPINEASRPS